MKPPTHGPQSFHGAPGLREGGSRSFYEVAQQAPVVPPTPLPPPVPARPKPALPPTLTLRYDERGPICELSKALRALLPPLKECERVLLVVPHQRGGQWYLDTNPKPGAGYRIPNAERAQFRVQPISKIHFMRPVPVLEGAGGRPGKGEDRRGGLAAVSNTNEAVGLLRFRLALEVPGHPGYYQLLREL